MKKIIFSLLTLAMAITFVSCGSEQSTAEKFLELCSGNRYEEAKGCMDEIMENFANYTSEEKSEVMAGLAALVSNTKDPILGDDFLTLYDKVKDDKTVEMDKNVSDFCDWIENGFTTGCDYQDASEEAPADENPANENPADGTTAATEGANVNNANTTNE